MFHITESVSSDNSLGGMSIGKFHLCILSTISICSNRLLRDNVLSCLGCLYRVFIPTCAPMGDILEQYEKIYMLMYRFLIRKDAVPWFCLEVLQATWPSGNGIGLRSREF